MPGRLRRRLVGVFVSLIGSACASKEAPRLVASLDLTEAETRAAEGCYLCLLDAQGRFERDAVHSAVARRRADETAVLIALRERELGLPDSGRLVALESRRAELAAPLSLLVDVAAAMPWNRRFAVDEDAALRQRAVAARDAWRVALDALPPDDAVEYARLSLACSYTSTPPRGPDAPRTLRSTPLLRFRQATCLDRDATILDSLVREVPRFVEARYLRGVAALIDGRIEDAERDVSVAFAALPCWTAAALTLAGIAFASEDFETALARYDDALAVDARQRDALLGRIKTLSYLNRHAEALASAGRMLTLGEYFIGDAHYWRAWNLFRLQRLEEAAAAVATSKNYMRGADPPALAGFIAIARDEFELARRELAAALQDAPADCDVRYALGGVESHFRAWSTAATQFERVVECFAARERETESTLAKLAPGDTRRQAARRREIDEARRQQGKAALDGAAAYVNLRDTPRARALAERAAGQPSSAAAAEKLLASLPK